MQAGGHRFDPVYLHHIKIINQLKFIHYINLPKVPQELIDELPTDIAFYNVINHGNYNWSDSFTEKINAWGKQFVGNEMYFAFQFMTGNIPVHKDIETQIKFVYLIDQGGTEVYTKFWNDNLDLLDQYKIETNRWHILKADCNHSVEGLEQGKIRRSITARIF